MIDLNHGSGPICPRPPTAPTSDAVNAHIDAALVARNRSQTPRDYLGGSRVGEPCERKLVYEVTHTPKDPGADFDGPILRVFDAGHAFEALSIRWLREAGFDLRDQRADGGQFGFEAAGGRLRGHIDGVIVAGPAIGVRWPALWEHKALNTKSWSDLVKRGLRLSKPVYFAQVQLYMAYMELGVALFTALNKDSQALYHEIVPFEPAEAQALSDKAVAIIRAAEAGELPPRMASAPDFYLCRMCDWAKRCWAADALPRRPHDDRPQRGGARPRPARRATTSTRSSPGCAARPRPGCRRSSRTAAASATSGGSPTSAATLRGGTAPASSSCADRTPATGTTSRPATAAVRSTPWSTPRA